LRRSHPRAVELVLPWGGAEAGSPRQTTPPGVTETAKLGFHFSLLAATFSAFSGPPGSASLRCSALPALRSTLPPGSETPALAGLGALRPVTPLHGRPAPSLRTQEAPPFMTHPHGVRSPTAVAVNVPVFYRSLSLKAHWGHPSSECVGLAHGEHLIKGSRREWPQKPAFSLPILLLEISVCV